MEYIDKNDIWLSTRSEVMRDINVKSVGRKPNGGRLDDLLF